MPIVKKIDWPYFTVKIQSVHFMKINDKCDDCCMLASFEFVKVNVGRQFSRISWKSQYRRRIPRSRPIYDLRSSSDGNYTHLLFGNSARLAHPKLFLNIVIGFSKTDTYSFTEFFLQYLLKILSSRWQKNYNTVYNEAKWKLIVCVNVRRYEVNK